VLSFGQISFVALGAFASGVMTVPLESKTGILPELFPVLRDHTIGNATSLLLAAAVGGVFAFLVGLPLMRLSGLAAGIATFAVLEITHNLLREWTKIGLARRLSARPRARHTAGDRGRSGRGRRRVRLPTQSARRQAARDARGSAAAQARRDRVYRQRLWAFTLSGALAASRRPLRAHARLDHTEQVYLELTFLTLAMLVVGGVTSLWGAVVGALAVSGLDSLLAEAEDGIGVGFTLDLPEGSRLVISAR
jgi:branched-chain amino acid transport system permease protein